MPPRKRLKTSNDPLDSSAMQLVMIKEEPEESIVNFVTESFSFENSDFDDEDSSEMLEEVSEMLDEGSENGKEKVKRKNRCYSNDAIKKAAAMVTEGQMTMYKAGIVFGVPRTTLKRYISCGGVKQKVGQGSVLNVAEEDELLDWLNVASDTGICRTKHELIEAAVYILRLNKKKGFKNYLPTKAWVNSFSRRHPGRVKLRSLYETINERLFFTKFHNFLTRNNMLGVLDRSDAFYVMEDVNFGLSLRVNNAWNRSKLRRTLILKAGLPDKMGKESVTVTYCFGADGRKFQELVIFNEDFKDMVKVALVDKEIDSKFLFTRTKSGGHTKESFKCYLQRIDAQLKNVQRPIFIFCAETLPHVNIDLFRWCKAREIFIISYIPNGISVLEECDDKIFGMNNSDWRKEVEEENEINEVEFTRILKKINDRTVNEEKITEIFYKIGLVPFDVSKIDESLLEKSNESKVEVKTEEIEVKTKDPVIAQHLRRFRQMNEQLKEFLSVKGFDELIESTLDIDKHIDRIESSI